MGCVESKDSRGKSRPHDSRSRPPPGPHDSRSRPPSGSRSQDAHNRQNTKVVKHPNGREYKPRGGRYDDTGQDPLYRPPGSRPPPRHQSSEFNPRKDLMFPPAPGPGGQAVAVYPPHQAFTSNTLSRKKGGGNEETRGYDTINRNRREAESRASNANSSFEIAKSKQDNMSASSTLPKPHSGNGIHTADRWSQSIDRRRKEGDGGSDTIRRGEKNPHNLSSENNKSTSRLEHNSNSTAMSINNNNSTAKTPSSKLAVGNGGETGASGGGTMRRASFDRSSQYRRSKRKRKKDSTVGPDSPAVNPQVSNRTADSSYLLKSSSAHHAELISAPNDSYNPDASYNDLAISKQTGFNSTGLSNGEHSTGLPANNDSKSPIRPNTDPKYGNLI